MSRQYVSDLPIFQKLSLRLRKQFNLNFPKELVQFLSMFSNFLKRRALRSSERRRSKILKKSSELIQKRTHLHKRRIILSSTKGLQLISIIPLLSLNDWHSMEQFVFFRTQFINHKLNFQENKNWKKSKKNRWLYQKILILFTVL